MLSARACYNALACATVKCNAGSLQVQRSLISSFASWKRLVLQHQFFKRSFNSNHVTTCHSVCISLYILDSSWDIIFVTTATAAPHTLASLLGLLRGLGTRLCLHKCTFPYTDAQTYFPYTCNWRAFPRYLAFWEVWERGYVCTNALFPILIHKRTFPITDVLFSTLFTCFAPVGLLPLAHILIVIHIIICQ